MFAKDDTTTRIGHPGTCPSAGTSVVSKAVHISISSSRSSSSSAKGSSSGKSPTVTLSGRTKLARSGPVSKYRLPLTLDRGHRDSVGHCGLRNPWNGSACVRNSRSVVLADRFVPFDTDPDTAVLGAKVGRADEADCTATVQLFRERDLAPRSRNKVWRDRGSGFGSRGGSRGEAAELISLLVS